MDTINDNVDCCLALDDCSTPTVQEYISQTIQAPGQEDAFYVVDIDDILIKHRLWIKNLPRVKPYYAVKCNGSRVVLEILLGLGLGFDCASKGEIQHLLSLNASPKDIVFANPCKPKSHIEYAAKVGVKLMTFDNPEELYKVAKIVPDAQLLLRLRVPDETAVCVLGTKYGAEMDDVENLLTLAKKLCLNVVGVSFHVGSGCRDADAYRVAINNSRYVFDVAEKMGFHMTLLDIGGGFPGSSGGGEPVTFEQMAAVINANLDVYFPPEQEVSVIAEPGRFYVASAFTLACNIIAKRMLPNEERPPTAMYYLNDGVYGSFNCTIFDHYQVEPLPYTHLLTGPDNTSDDDNTIKNTGHDRDYRDTILWGPTCDSMDCIKKDFHFPEMHLGEWIIFPSMGAYTIAAASNFNGFRTPCLKYFLKSYAYGVISKFFNWSKIAKILRLPQNERLIEPKAFRSGSLPLNMIEVS